MFAFTPQPRPTLHSGRGYRRVSRRYRGKSTEGGTAWRIISQAIVGGKRVLERRLLPVDRDYSEEIMKGTVAAEQLALKEAGQLAPCGWRRDRAAAADGRVLILARTREFRGNKATDYREATAYGRRCGDVVVLAIFTRY